MSDPNVPPAAPGYSKSFLTHLVVMPRFHQSLLGLAMLLAGGGTLGQIAGYFKGPATPTVQTTTTAPGGSSFVDANEAPTATPAEAPPQTIGERVAPWATRVGFAYIVGFVVGWAFRAFIKIMSLLTMAGVSIIAGLSYFHILNVDMTTTQQKYESVMHWVTDQGSKAASALMHHFPGSASSFAGMFLGFKRK